MTKRTIPEIQSEIIVISNFLVAMSRRLNLIRDELSRRKAVRRAPRKSASMTAAKKLAIKRYAAKNKSASYKEIANHFNVNQGRVSEALAGKRGKKGKRHG